MPVTTRFVAFVLWACCLAALPAYADDSPQAHLEGFRCEVLRDGETPPGVPVPTVVACQIEDGANPFVMIISPLADSPATSPPLDALLDLLSTLDHALHNASLPQHDAVVPPPTP